MEWVLWVAFWVACGWVASRIMASKGRSETLGWVLGLLLAIVGIVICALYPKTVEQKARDAVAVDAEVRRLRGN